MRRADENGHEAAQGRARESNRQSEAEAWKRAARGEKPSVTSTAYCRRLDRARRRVVDLQPAKHSDDGQSQILPVRLPDRKGASNIDLERPGRGLVDDRRPMFNAKLRTVCPGARSSATEVTF